MSRILVPDWGDREARIVLVGDAPSEDDERERQPFVSSIGRTLHSWWRDAGLIRSDFYLTNVIPWHPPYLRAVTREERAECEEKLHARLAALHDPYVIVTLGAWGLEALTGHSEISKYRGSILAYRDRTGRTIKVIPALHPLQVFRRPKMARLCVQDWRRIRDDAAFKELRLHRMTNRINPTVDDVEELARDCETGHVGMLAIDIETPRTVKHVQHKHLKTGRITKRKVYGDAYIGCIGFARNANESLTVPLTLAYWKDEELLRRVIAAVKRICESAVAKALQNGLFDCYWLKSDLDINVVNFAYDPRYMHHVIDAPLPHDLATLGSIYTRQPFWKDEAKDPDELIKYVNNNEALWTYNGIDCCVTWAVANALIMELVAKDRWSFYREHYMDCFPIALDMMLHGMLIDTDEMGRRRAELDEECSGIEKELERLVGYKLHATKGLSPTKLKKYLYEELKLPKQYKRNAMGQMTITTDEIAVRKLLANYEGKKNHDRLMETGPLILRHREARKQAEFLDPTIVDRDGRIRCSLGFATDAGRWSSASNPKGTGRNLQNIDRKLKGVFLADA